MWDLTLQQPNRITWRAQRNLSVNTAVQKWVVDQRGDAWRGVTAQVQQPITTNSDYDAFLPLYVEQWVTVIAPPVWTWHTVDMLSGEFMVAAATTDAHAYHTRVHEEAVQVGSIPLVSLVGNSAAQPI